MKLNAFIIIFLVLFQAETRGQSCCINNDFSAQNFSYWQGFTGFYGGCCSDQGIVNGRHTIINSQGADPHTCGGLQMIPAGYNQSCRLGNDAVGGEAEMLRKTMCVSPDESILIYRYSIVLQEPGHLPENQPKFDFKILDSVGLVLDSLCGQYSVYAQPGLPGFQTCLYNNGIFLETVVWRDWTVVGFDLSPYIGQTITIEFSTFDCNLGAHYGYAYFVSECEPAQIFVSKCLGDSVVDLSAPMGFTYLWFNGDTTPVISLINPDTSIFYSVMLTSVTGCSFTLQTKIQPTQIFAGIEIQDSCANNVDLFALDSVINGTPDSYLWNFGTGLGFQPGNKIQSYQYANAGVYQIELAVQSNTGCWDTAQRQVTILAAPDASYITSDLCEGEPIQFNNTTAVSGPYSTEWWIDNTLISNSSNLLLSLGSGPHAVRLVVTSQTSGCSDFVEENIQVEVKPQIEMSALPDLCSNDHPLYLSPFSSNNLPGIPVFSGSGVLGCFFNPQQAGPGMHPVQLIFNAANGCSDTITQYVYVQAVPEIQSETTPTLCVYSNPVNLRNFVSHPGSPDSLFFQGTGVVQEKFYPDMAGVGVHEILVTNGSQGNKCIDSLLIPIAVLPTPEIIWEPEINLCLYQDVFELPEAYPASGEYSGNAINNQGVINPQELGTGNYIVKYKLEYFEGCILRDTMKVFISDKNCICKFYIANSFTPNDDGVNDVFAPGFDCEILEYQLMIFNRWGTMVFETKDEDASWDGNYQGQACPIDSYVVYIYYKAKYNNISSISISSEIFQGVVNLIR